MADTTQAQTSENAEPTPRRRPGKPQALSAEQQQSAIKQYQSGMSMAVVGKSFGVTAATIGNMLKRHGIPARPRTSAK